MFEYPYTNSLVLDIHINILLIDIHNLDIYKIQRYLNMDIYVLNIYIIYRYLFEKYRI